MKNIQFKKLLPHIIAIVSFLILSLIFTFPAMQGKVVEQHDVQQVKAMQQQSYEFEQKNGYFPRWTNSMFAGMPAYQIAFGPKHGELYSIAYVHRVFSLGLPKPCYYLFVTCLMFYLLGIVLRINPWVSMIGAIAYGYCSYNPILIAVGHDTKLLSMAYTPAVIASIILIFQRKYWLGTAALLTSSCLLLQENHQQIVYYAAIVSAFVVLHYAIKLIKEKAFKDLALSLGLLIIIPLFALATVALHYFSTYEYSKESMRGGSELTKGNKSEVKTQGLDRDYAFNWSYGKVETMSFMVANACGGGSATPLGEDSKVLEVLQSANQMPQDFVQQLYQSAGAYWGGRPSTSGPVYFGAIISLLFLLGAFVSKSEHKWWLLSVTVIGIILAWGKYFSSINYFLFDHLPFYNKFRTPEMALVIPQLSFALLGSIFVNGLINEKDAETLKKIGKKSLIVCGGVLALLFGFYFLADFKNDATAELRKSLTSAFQGNNTDFIREYFAALTEDRKAIYLSDMWRSLGFIVLAAGAIWAYTRKYLSANVMIVAVLLLSTIDLGGVAKRYLNENNFVEASDYEAAYSDYNADIQIKRDPGFFRILNLAFRDPGSGNFQASIGNAFNDAIASYKHNNIGGYHPAKLALFEDLKEHQIYKNIQNWASHAQAKDSFPVLNMLNMRYVIVPDQANPKQTTAIPNPFALGNCWLVKEIKFVPNANAEMDALDSFDPSTTAIIDNRFKSIADKPIQYDSTAYIKLISNNNDYIKYEYSGNTDQFAVFSEIYYSKGWHASIDGKPADYCRVNYALRGMPIPAGKHTIEFNFESKLVENSELTERISGWLSILVVLFCGFMVWKQQKKEDA